MSTAHSKCSIAVREHLGDVCHAPLALDVTAAIDIIAPSRGRIYAAAQPSIDDLSPGSWTSPTGSDVGVPVEYHRLIYMWRSMRPGMLN